MSHNSDQSVLGTKVYFFFKFLWCKHWRQWSNAIYYSIWSRSILFVKVPYYEKPGTNRLLYHYSMTAQPEYFIVYLGSMVVQLHSPGFRRLTTFISSQFWSSLKSRESALIDMITCPVWNLMQMEPALCAHSGKSIVYLNVFSCPQLWRSWKGTFFWVVCPCFHLSIHVCIPLGRLAKMKIRIVSPASASIPPT